MQMICCHGNSPLTNTLRSQQGAEQSVSTIITSIGKGDDKFLFCIYEMNLMPIGECPDTFIWGKKIGIIIVMKLRQKKGSNVAYVGVLEAHQRTTLPALISGLYPREFEDGDL